MNLRKRLLAAVAVVIAISAGTLVFAAPAQAAYAPPPYPTDGNTYVYGAPIGQFLTTQPTKRATVGGWLNQDWHKTSLGYSINNTGNPWRPLWFELWEPWFDPATNSVKVPVYSNAPQDNQNNGNTYASAYGASNGTLGSTVPKVYCQKTEWAVAGASTSTSYPMAGSFSGQQGGFNGAASSGVGSATVLNGSNLTNCPYIREIDVKVQSWNCPPSGTTCAPTEMIEAWYAKNSYVDHTVYKSYEGLRDICALTISTATNPVSPGCTDILGQAGKIDGEDFNVVCANPPASWVWGDFSWLPAFIGFYAKCLWSPVNGWDRDGTMANAWNNGPPGQLAAPITSMVNALNLPNNCGVIVPAAPGVLGGVFSLNTCSWSWATSLHDGLALILPMWFGWWALWFVVSAISGVINRKVPSPAQLGREE